MTEYKRMRPLLGTFVEIGIRTEMNDAHRYITMAFKQIETIQNLLSFHDPNSDLSKLNRHGFRGVELNPLSADVLRLALHMTGVSGGDFNCTIGGSLVRRGVLPDHGGFFPEHCGSQDDVELDGCHAILKKPIRITLDGIAKGYAVDHAVNYLRSHGIESGWINAGGDMRIFGEVELPVYQKQLDEGIQYLGRFSNTAIATSNNPAQYDERYPGLILNSNNQTLRPGVWTVKAGLLWLADALTKVACVNELATSQKKITSLGGSLIGVSV
jgi:thiamine biosynthesis lipoprotein